MAVALAGLGSAAALGACRLPPASIEAPVEVALTPSAADGDAGLQCRALISERSPRGPVTHELRWSEAGVQVQTHPGLAVGTAEYLFAVRAQRVVLDPASIYPSPDPSLRCEQDQILVRRLPNGVSAPLVEALPACAGELDGRPVALDSTLELVSSVGPLLAWRAAAEGLDPDPVGVLAYRSIDLRDSQPARPEDWLREPSASMIRAEIEPGGCERQDTPRTLERARGFALRWDPSAEAGLSFRVGYGCCDWDHNHNMCEFDDPLPSPDPELRLWIPDADLLVHAPDGCGSIGLDGSVRTRDGDPVGEHGVDPATLLGIVFLPADHPFEGSWL